VGNGYTVAAVIARQELFDRLKVETEVFSIFGGNPVAAPAALAVLDVIEDERLIENAKRVGMSSGEPSRSWTSPRGAAAVCWSALS
jgi:4-aminobutyrate aminotransferase-like enzyme